MIIVYVRFLENLLKDLTNNMNSENLRYYETILAHFALAKSEIISANFFLFFF